MDTHNNGFTLVELIIALVLMGIISAFVYPNFSRLQIKAKENAVKTVVYTLQMAVESFFLSTGEYPQDAHLLSSQLMAMLVESGDLRKTPNNPFTGKPYSQNDASGDIFYNYDATMLRYSIEGKGLQNKKTIVSLQN
jgi:prepilin-type N-terminal cleavage/methylation domain-containing protein